MNKIGDVEVPIYRVELVRDRSVPVGNFKSFDKTLTILHAMLDKSPVEKFVCCYINSHNELVGAEEVATGDLDHVEICMRNLFRGAVLAAVPRVLIAHNHPTSDLTPSDPDISITAMAIQAGAALNIELVDHIIVAPNGKHFSFWDNQSLIESRIIALNLTSRINKYLKSSHKFVEPLLNKKTPTPEELTNHLLDSLSDTLKRKY